MRLHVHCARSGTGDSAQQVQTGQLQQHMFDTVCQIEQAIVDRGYNMHMLITVARNAHSMYVWSAVDCGEDLHAEGILVQQEEPSPAA